MTWSVSTALFFGLILVAFSGENDQALLELQAAYQQSHAEIVDKREASLDVIRARRVPPLERMLQKSTEAGKLEEATALRNFISLIRGKPTEPGLNDDKFFQDEKRAFTTESDKIYAVYDAKEKLIRDTYRVGLEGLVTDLVRDGNIEEAIGIRWLSAQIEKISIREGVVINQRPGEPTDQVTSNKVAVAAVDVKGVPPYLQRNTLFYLNFDKAPEAKEFVAPGIRQAKCHLMGDPGFVPGPRGNAIHLTKTNDFVKVVPFQLGREITLAGWVRYDKDTPWGHMIKMSDHGKNAEVAIYCDSTANMVTTMSGRGNDKTYLGAGKIRELKTWMHFVSTCDTEGNIRFYKNGKFLKTRKRSIGISQHPRAVMHIGRDLGWNGEPSTEGVYGCIDEIIVLDRALNQEEVGSFYLWFGGGKQKIPAKDTP